MPYVSYLYDCQPLSCALSGNNIARTVDDDVRSLGVNINSFCPLFADAVK